MPPKKAGPDPSSSSFFVPGGYKEVFVKPQPQPAAKKQKKSPATPTPPPPPKTSFFKPGGQKKETAAPKSTPFSKKPTASFTPRRSFLYDKYTDEPYAEWIGNEAVCLETGEVLFVSTRGGEEEDYFCCEPAPPSSSRFDFTPPAHKHPRDPSIASQDLIDKGILTLDDFRTGNAGLSVEAYKKYMMELLAVRD